MTDSIHQDLGCDLLGQQELISLFPADIAKQGITPEHFERLRSIVGQWPYFTYPSNSEKYPDNFASYSTEALKSYIDYEFAEALPGVGTPNRLKQNRILDASGDPQNLRRYLDRLWHVTRTLFNETRMSLSADLWQRFSNQLPPETRAAAEKLRSLPHGQRPAWTEIATIFRRELCAEMDRETAGKQNYLPALLALIQIDHSANRFSCNFVAGAAGRYCDADFTATALCQGLSQDLHDFALQELDTAALFAGLPEARPYKRI